MQKEWWEKSFLNKNEKNFIITELKTNKAIGTISLVDIDMRNRKCELGRVYVDSKSKGIGTESTELVLQYSFNHLNLNKIYLEVFDNNKRAQSLYKKIGFTQDGTHKEHIYKNGIYLDIQIMSILKKEYFSRKSIKL